MDSNNSHTRGGIAPSQTRCGLRRRERGDAVRIRNGAESADTVHTRGNAESAGAAEPMRLPGEGCSGGASAQVAGGAAAFSSSARARLRKAVASAGMLALALVLSASCTYAWFSGTQTGLNRAGGAGRPAAQTGSIVLECHVDKSGGELPEYVGEPTFGYSLALSSGESDISSVIYKIIRGQGESGEDLLEEGPNGFVYDADGNVVGSGRLSDFNKSRSDDLTLNITLQDGWSFEVCDLPLEMEYASSYDPARSSHPDLFETKAPSGLENGSIEPDTKVLPYIHIYKCGRGSLDVSKAVEPVDGVHALEDKDYATLYSFTLHMDDLASVEGGVLVFADGSKCIPRLIDVDKSDLASVQAKEARERYWGDHPEEELREVEASLVQEGALLCGFSLYPGQHMRFEGLPTEVEEAGELREAAFEVKEQVSEGAGFSPVQADGLQRGTLSSEVTSYAPFVNVIGSAGAGVGGLVVEKQVAPAEQGADIEDVQVQESFRFDVSLPEGALDVSGEGDQARMLSYILVDKATTDDVPTKAWLQAWMDDPESVDMPAGWTEHIITLQGKDAAGSLTGTFNLKHGQSAYLWGLASPGSVHVEEALTQEQADLFAQPMPSRDLNLFAGMLVSTVYTNTYSKQEGPVDPIPPGPVDPDDPVDPVDPTNPDNPDTPDEPDNPSEPDDPVNPGDPDGTVGPDGGISQGGSSAPSLQASPVIRRIRVLAQTGDPAFYIALALLGAAIVSIVAALLLRRKKG